MAVEGKDSCIGYTYSPRGLMATLITGGSDRQMSATLTEQNKYDGAASLFKKSWFMEEVGGCRASMGTWIC